MRSAWCHIVDIMEWDWHDIMLTSALCHVMTGIVLIKESKWKTFWYWYHWHLFNFCRWSECFSPSLWSSCCVGDQNSSWPSSSAMNSQHFIQRTHLLLMWVKLEINSLFDCCKFPKWSSILFFFHECHLAFPRHTMNYVSHLELFMFEFDFIEIKCTDETNVVNNVRDIDEPYNQLLLHPWQ